MIKILEYGVPTGRCGVQLRLGIEKGFFRGEGIDLRLRIVFGGPAIAAEFDSGDLIIGELGAPPALTALSKGARFKIVGSSVRRGAVQYFVAHPRFVSWPDLRGARLGALSRGSCSDWYMRELLTHNGLDPDADVTIVGLERRYPKILDFLADGELDGAILSEPHVTIGEQTGLFNVWLGLNALSFTPRMQWSVVVANAAELDQKPALIEAVLRGCRTSYRYAAANLEEWADFGARHFGISRDVMRKSIEREFDDLHFDGELDLPGLESAIALQRKLGALARPVQLADIVDDRFIRLS